MISIQQPGGGSGKVDVVVTPNPEKGVTMGMGLARTNFAVAIDGNGDMYFVGGIVGTNPQAVVEKVTRSGDIIRFPDMAYPRNNAACAIDGDGNLVIAGGYIQSSGVASTAVIERYTKDGVKLATPGALGRGRIEISAITDDYGRVWFIGGYSGSSVSSQIEVIGLDGNVVATYDTGFSSRGMPVSKDGEGNIWVAHGSGGDSGYSYARRISPSGVVTNYSLAGNRQRLNASAGPNGTVIFVGGVYSSTYYRTAESFTPSGIKTALPALSNNMIDGGGALSGDGSVIFAGGATGTSTSSASKSACRYDFDSEGIANCENLSDMITERNPCKILTDYWGNVVCFGWYVGTGSGPQVTVGDVYYNRKQKPVLVPAWNKYRFQEHETAQGPFPEATQVLVNTPNIGRFTQMKGAIAV